MEKVLIGSGGFAREVKTELDTKIKVFVDDEFSDGIATLPLSSFDSQKYSALIAIGDPIVRNRIVDKLPKDTQYWTHVSKYALILGNDVNIGLGCIISAGVIITTNVIIGNHVQLNLQTTIGHDSILKNFITTAPSVNISGNVTIDDRVYLGTNAVIKEKINIASDVIIGMNCGVTKHINESGTYVGTPATKIR